MIRVHRTTGDRMTACNKRTAYLHSVASIPFLAAFLASHDSARPCGVCWPEHGLIDVPREKLAPIPTSTPTARPTAAPTTAAPTTGDPLVDAIQARARLLAGGR